MEPRKKKEKEGVGNGREHRKMIQMESVKNKQHKNEREEHKV